MNKLIKYFKKLNIQKYRITIGILKLSSLWHINSYSVEQWRKKIMLWVKQLEIKKQWVEVELGGVHTLIVK